MAALQSSAFGNPPDRLGFCHYLLNVRQERHAEANLSAPQPPRRQKAHQDGRLTELESCLPRHYRAVTLRYGILGSNPVYLKYKDIGTMFGHMTRQNVQQMIKKSFKMLEGKIPRRYQVGIRYVVISEHEAKLVRTIACAAARHWGIPTENILVNQYRNSLAYQTTIYLMHTRYGWSFEKIRSALGLNKAAVVEQICRKIRKKVDRRQAVRKKSRLAIKFFPHFDALCAELSAA
jgi:hypothetical protein